MSASVRLSGKLRKDDELNGLDSLAASLAADPSQKVAAIVWLTVPKITFDVDTGEHIPTVQVKRIEPIGTLDKVPSEIIDLAAELQSKRLGGREALPFDTVEVIEGYAYSPDGDGDE